MKIKFDWKGFEAVRRSGPVQSEVNRVAQSLALRAGADYSWDSQQGEKGPSPSWNKPMPGYKAYEGRFRAIVYPNSYRAMRDNATNNTLAKLAGGFW